MRGNLLSLFAGLLASQGVVGAEPDLAASNQASAIAEATFIHHAAAAPGERARIEVHGDWTIGEDLHSEDVVYEVYGNIYLEEGATWELVDSELRIMCRYAREFVMRWRGGTFITRNCTVGGNFFDDRLRATNFQLEDGQWHATDTTVQHCYGIAFNGPAGNGGILRATRLRAGPNPDAVILGGDADVLLEDSTYPIALSVDTKQGGRILLDLPVNEPIDRIYEASSLLGAEEYRLELRRHRVPLWFLFVRNVGAGHVPAEITVDRCEALLLNILTRNLRGEVHLTPDLSTPLQLGPVTIQRGAGPVDLRMFGGFYFSGDETDLTLRGSARLAEVMMWAGKVRIIGDGPGEMLLTCTTVDLHHDARLEVEHLQLGRPHGNGQVIVRDEASFRAREVQLGALILQTHDRAAIEISDYTPVGPLTIESRGQPVALRQPKSQ